LRAAALHRGLGAGQPRALGTLALFSICLLTWQLAHPYRGIFHDAGLYVLQGLAPSQPALRHDVFLDLGSQDRYSAFAPLFGLTSRLGGLASSAPLSPEATAAVLTLLSQLAFFTAAGTLARVLNRAGSALLALAVLIAVPGEYGADRIFACVEPFVTARMAGEALTLAGIAAALTHRRLAASALMVLALALHPIMAAAGLVTLFFLYVGAPRPGIAAGVIGGALLMPAVLAGSLPAGGWGRFDPHWLALVESRSPYLFLSSWRLEDWSRLAVVLGTLSVGALGVPSVRVTAICRAVLLTVAAGLTLAYVGCDRLHLVAMARLQPWRWQWLGTAIAALLLPAILAARWRADGAGRASALLLAAGWIFGANESALGALLMLLVISVSARWLRPAELRLVTLGSWAMLILAALWRVSSNLQFTETHYLDSDLPIWLKDATSLCTDGSLPVAVALLIGAMARGRRTYPALAALTALAAAGMLLILPHSWSLWTRREYPPRLAAELEPWRRIVAPTAQVFWPESPPAAWVLLDRPQYLSVLQTSGMVYSRAAAFELERRARALDSVIPARMFLGWDAGGTSIALSAAQLEALCGLGAFEFLVTSVDLGREPRASVAVGQGPKRLRLYECAAPESARQAGWARQPRSTRQAG
jgi:hypothetical protein